MIESKAATEYAQAMFELAGERELETEYSEAFIELRKLLVDNPEYIELLASPGIPMVERHAAVDAVFGSGNASASTTGGTAVDTANGTTDDIVRDDIASLLKLLSEKGRIRDIIGIIDEYQSMYKSAIGISPAHVISAAPLTDIEKSTLREKLEKKLQRRVELEFSTDESLIGGLVIHVDGRIIDGSVRGRLSEFRESIK